MAYLRETDCCGIRELSDVMGCDNAREAVVDAAEWWFEKDKDGAYIFYSVTSDSRIGHAIESYIAKYKLGVVQRTHSTRNPNSENMLTMWMWTINKTNFKAYWHNTKRYAKKYKNRDTSPSWDDDDDEDDY